MHVSKASVLYFKAGSVPRADACTLVVSSETSGPVRSALGNSSNQSFSTETLSIVAFLFLQYLHGRKVSGRMFHANSPDSVSYPEAPGIGS